MRELKPSKQQRGRLERCRTPPGVRELKLVAFGEMSTFSGRTPPGVRELKLLGLFVPSMLLSRTPPGVRELKRKIIRPMSVTGQSHPSRGA